MVHGILFWIDQLTYLHISVLPTALITVVLSYLTMLSIIANHNVIYTPNSKKFLAG